MASFVDTVDSSSAARHIEKIPTPERLREFLRGCRASRNLRRAGKTALVVGPLLAMINQTQAVWHMLHGEMLPPIAAMRICLTFAVPFLVSLYSSAMAESAPVTPTSRTSTES